MTGPRLDRLSLNQRTTASWTLPQAVQGCVDAGLPAIGVWREQLAEVGLEEGCRLVREAGLRVSSLCRGGFFTATDPADVRAAEARNREALEEAAALGAATLVLVPGGLPAGDRDLEGARHRVATAVERLVPYAHELGVTLGIEPMNPVYAADRGVVSTLASALDLAERFDAADVGVVVDTFHLWWEPGVAEQLLRAGPRIVSYQVCDWITPLPADTLLARGMMGDGHVDFAAFSRAVGRAGYTGDVEVEIFNADVWAQPPAEVVATLSTRYLALVEPYLVEA
ncbi:sugar phosphate isomerase/epimerase family protein [Microlunatus flavus]|uniref:Sugar phosphate isomerase/epimerase n=1 Tax=Microlunatus flavus TaxID=1036181 RepID=A0A1H9G1C0_9ACTN|nr:sugar phosphate isomerase/epimerase [Microlunatus flavus]SEQ43930.1 Sugar phosphate isomerase/epimerase [Microlunatus flavus]